MEDGGREDGLCCSSSAIQTRLGPSSLLEEQSEIPIVFVVSFVLLATPQTGGNGEGISIYIYIPWPFPPVWGVADNTKETTKTIGVSLRSSSNDEGSSRVWMALLEQHNPSSPVFHNLRRFIDAVSPTAPTTGLRRYIDR